MNAVALILLTETESAVADKYRERELRREASAHPELWDLLDKVSDPEIPVISIWDLGVLQDVRVDAGRVEVVLIPTYSGCPAMREIQDDVIATLTQAGCADVNVSISMTPPWSTDWLSSVGRQRLLDYGIAPPLSARSATTIAPQCPQCPQCGSKETSLVSEFGSTACKALYKCDSCLEPFDYFKCL